MIDIHASVEQFAAAMERKLRENEQKGSWEECGVWYLWDRLLEELDELERAIEAGDPNEVLSEAADVGNFAMMLADVVRIGRAKMGIGQ